MLPALCKSAGVPWIITWLQSRQGVYLIGYVRNIMKNISINNISLNISWKYICNSLYHLEGMKYFLKEKLVAFKWSVRLCLYNKWKHIFLVPRTILPDYFKSLFYLRHCQLKYLKYFTELPRVKKSTFNICK